MKSASVRTGAARCILLVEDDRQFAQLLRELLEAKGGYAVTVASSGSAALEIAKTLRPEIILMDKDFRDTTPRPNGWETMQLLRKLPETARTPIVLMTGANPSDVDVEEARQAGFNAVILKPFFSEELMAPIERLLAEVK